MAKPLDQQRRVYETRLHPRVAHARTTRERENGDPTVRTPPTDEDYHFWQDFNVLPRQSTLLSATKPSTINGSTFAKNPVARLGL